MFSKAFELTNTRLHFRKAKHIHLDLLTSEIGFCVYAWLQHIVIFSMTYNCHNALSPVTNHIHVLLVLTIVP